MAERYRRDTRQQELINRATMFGVVFLVVGLAMFYTVSYRQKAPVLQEKQGVGLPQEHEVMNHVKRKTVEVKDEGKGFLRGMKRKAGEKIDTAKERIRKATEYLANVGVMSKEEMERRAAEIALRTGESKEAILLRIEEMQTPASQRVREQYGKVPVSEVIKEKATVVRDSIKERLQGIEEEVAEIKEGLKEKAEDVKEGAKEKMFGTKEKAEELKESVEGRGEEMKEKLKEGAYNVKESLKEGAYNLKEGLKEKLEGIQEKGEEGKEGMKEEAKSIGEKLREGVQDLKEKLTGKEPKHVPEGSPGKKYVERLVSRVKAQAEDLKKLAEELHDEVEQQLE